MKTSIMATTIFLLQIAGTAGQRSYAGPISKVYTYGDGRLLALGPIFSKGNCSNGGGKWVSKSHPDKEMPLSLLLTAHSTGKEVTTKVETDDCWYPEITSLSNIFLRINE